MALKTVEEKLSIYKHAFKEKYIEILEKNPRRLIQSAEKSSKRYEVLKGLQLSLNELEEYMFISEAQFEKKYKALHQEQ